MVLVAIIATVITTLAHHLGFFDAVRSISDKVLKCYKCCTFWVTLTSLILMCCSPLYAVAVAFAAAYLSNWIALIWGELNIIYMRLWQKQENRRNKNSQL